MLEPDEYGVTSVGDFSAQKHFGVVKPPDA